MNTWTADDLKALEAAIASGARRVSYGDRTVEYHDLDAMLKLRERMRLALGVSAPSLRVYPVYSKGAC